MLMPELVAKINGGLTDLGGAYITELLGAVWK
jgi:hypothetical protein